MLNVGHNSIRVRWKVCKDGESPKAYHLTCEGRGSPLIEPLEEVMNRGFMEYTIQGLAQKTTYNFRLTCSEGESNEVLKKYKKLTVQTLGNEIYIYHIYLFRFVLFVTT